MTTPVLEAKGLSIAFGGLRAVDGLSFTATRHRITTIIGPNGAGKSTAFNLISGALRPHSGHVMVEGKDLTGQPPERLKAAGLSRSFQITSLFFDLTVAENLQIASQALDPRWRALLPVSCSTLARQRAGRMMERFRLAGKAGEMVGNLSHGEQRRLEIAMCLASEPKILLLDEPTQGMSHGDTQETAALIKTLANDVTILLIEHDIGLVMSLSDHVVVMHQGCKIAEGAPMDVRANPAVQAAYFGVA